MSWKFWEKKKEGADSQAGKVKKLPRPKELPSSVGRYLVVNLKQDPDWVWSLRCVLRQREAKKNEMDIRIFDVSDAQVKGVSVRDYDSFETHPGAILFEGWYDKISHAAEIHRKTLGIEKGAA